MNEKNCKNLIALDRFQIKKLRWQMVILQSTDIDGTLHDAPTKHP